MAGILDSDGDLRIPLHAAPEPSLRASLNTPLENDVTEPSQDVLAESLDLALKESLRIVIDKSFENRVGPQFQDHPDPLSPENRWERCIYCQCRSSLSLSYMLI